MPEDKLSREVLAHQREKQRPADRTAEQHRAALSKAGLNPELSDAEECALYVREPLSRQEIARLGADGVEVDPSVWVPPVPGKHDHGYHLARVKYGSLDRLRADDRFVFVDSTEFSLSSDLDAAVTLGHALEVQNGSGVSIRKGNGVRIAVADSGLDLTHPDIPAPLEAFDMTDGTDPATWGTDVRNHVTLHGTHVTGIAVGRGTLSGGRYRGVAPEADLCFYKTGNDTTGTHSTTDVIEAVNRALAVGCKVFSVSATGYSTYMDGSSAQDQAIDAASAAGMICFVSAGNAAARAEHYSVSVPPNTISAQFTMTVINPSSSSPYVSEESIRVIWRDNAPANMNINLACANLGAGESLTQAFVGVSTRQTEAKRYALVPNVPAGGSKTYQFTLQNTATTGTSPLVHCYRSSGVGKFDNPDPNYTVASPAHADSAIAVGAITHRNVWTDYQGRDHVVSSYTVGALAYFSSLGPRLDGLHKPDLVAPGAMMISTRDLTPGLPASSTSRIDNDGLNLNGSGPADYYITEGTSMACPFAAGVAALLIQDRPSWTATQVRARLEQTSASGASPDNSIGHGLINALAAVAHIKGDFDGNDRVDITDFDTFVACATGPALLYDIAHLPSGCDLEQDGQNILPADFDRDGDIDHSDYGEWQAEYTGQ